MKVRCVCYYFILGKTVNGVHQEVQTSPETKANGEEVVQENGEREASPLPGVPIHSK